MAAFLRDHWQKSATLIRNPWADWHNPLEPDELAGLACEEGVESRLITKALPQSDVRTGSWQLEQGPLAEDRFGGLGKTPWTILVQAVDQHVPAVAALIEPFRFIPDWRIDDVMVSYASDGAGVGAHYDQYDVFLIQGLGRRRWRIGQHCDETTPLLPHSDLRLLSDFEPQAEWVLEPGDILYVPPGVAHEGVALGDDCMTYSIGFRAPSRAELIADWCDEIVADMTDDDRFADPDLAAAGLAGSNPGEIMPAALDRLHAMVLEAVGDRAAFARWFGRFTTMPKYPDMDWSPEAPIAAGALRARLATGASFERNPASRFSFVRESDGRLLLFVDGEMIACAGEAALVAEHLCAMPVSHIRATSQEAIALVQTLLDQGQIALME